MESTITLTFGDRAENHKGMQMLGTSSDRGFNLSNLATVKNWFAKRGVESKIHYLNKNLPTREDAPIACILIVEKGVDCILKDIGKTKEDFYKEQLGLEWDKKAKMYGRVCNKTARYNLCYQEEAQEPCYEEGKGRIISFDDVECLNYIRETIPKMIGETGEGLVVEGNYYHDPEKCGIGYHGDSERKKVIGIRLGREFSLHYQWYYRGEPVGENIKFILPGGSLYIMSEVAVGTNWKKREIYTIRHAAGCKKYTNI